MQFSSHLLFFVSLFVLCLTDTDVSNWTLAATKCGEKEKTFTLLDISKEFINKAKYLYPDCTDDELNCGKKEKSLAFLDVAMNVISKIKKSYPTKPISRTTSRAPDPECLKHNERPIDCSDILRSGKNESGVYTIWPRSRISPNKSITVYCDMDTDGGGWTVLQRRGRFSTPKDYFYKDWQSYKQGFGNITEEFWIGNDNIYSISNQAFINKPYKIRFDLKDAAGKTGYAEYNTFWIEDEATNYTLHIEGYKGNVGDSMGYHHKNKFSTKDRKNDKWFKSCAVAFQGAWWYDSCGYSNLNGLYQPGIVSDNGLFWYYWTNTRMGLSAVEIKLRS